MTCRDIQRNIKGFGLLKTLQDIAFRALNRVVYVRVLKAIRICQVDPKFTECSQNYRGGFLETAKLMQFSADPANELTTDFLREALRNGDECYAFLDGGSLASYGWYSKRPTAIEPCELVLHFDSQYIYMYKGLTHENHRGQRLHSAGMGRALEAYIAQGYKGIVSYVEWNNFASLKSCYRMGYVDFGNILFARIFGRFFIYCSAGCRPYGFRLEWRKSEMVSERSAATSHSAHI